MNLRRFIACSLLFAGSMAWAQDAMPHKAIDARLDVVLYDLTAQGVKLFNAGSEEACYRLFEGALKTALPMLDHRLDVKKRVEERMAKAAEMPLMADRAFALREAIDDIRKSIKASAGVADRPTVPKTMWDRMGREAGVRDLVRDMMTRVAADPRVDITRGGKIKPTPETMKALEQKLVEYLSSITGGPLPYKGKSMKDAHKGMAITDNEFTAFKSILAKVLVDHKVLGDDLKTLLAKIDALHADIVETPPVKTMWERLGNEAGVRAIVKDIMKQEAADPKINFSRGGKFKLDEAGKTRLENQIVHFFSAATGGPLKYTGKNMLDAHKGMAITDAEFSAFAALVAKVLKDHKVSAEDLELLTKSIETLRKDVVEKK